MHGLQTCKSDSLVGNQGVVPLGGEVVSPDEPVLDIVEQASMCTEGRSLPLKLEDNHATANRSHFRATTMNNICTLAAM